MPLSRYFNKPGNGQPGKGASIMAAMQRRYGAKGGERVFYATVNKMRAGSPAQRAAQPAAAPGSALSQAAQRRRRGRPVRLAGPPQANGARIEGASTSTSRVGF